MKLHYKIKDIKKNKKTEKEIYSVCCSFVQTANICDMRRDKLGRILLPQKTEKKIKRQQMLKFYEFYR